MSASLSEAIGLAGETVAAGGIGGILKARVSDFRVEEESKTVSLDNKGRFTLARITLTNWETNRFVKQLAKRLRISSNRIWFAGTKDKRAITKQLFVIDCNIRKVQEIEMTDVEIEILGRTHQKLGFGSHRGNRFTIVVRGCAHEDGSAMSEDEAMAEIEKIKCKLEERLGKGRFPNFVGPQRFGAGRPVTAEVAKFLLTGDIGGAVSTYIGFPGPNEQEETAAFRKCWRDTKDPEAALQLVPDHLGWEREMLRHIAENPEDYAGAFNKMPKSLQLLSIHALQSLIFNHHLQMRIDDEMPISTPIEGDIVGPLDESGSLEVSRMVKTIPSTLPRIERNCQLGRLVPTGVLPGTSTEEPGKYEKQALELLGLEDTSWKVDEMPRLSSKGTRRALVGTFREFVVDTVPIADSSTLGEKWQGKPGEEERWHPEGACIKFRFILPSGTYATTLLREFMRSPIHQM